MNVQERLRHSTLAHLPRNHLINRNFSWYSSLLFSIPHNPPSALTQQKLFSWDPRSRPDQTFLLLPWAPSGKGHWATWKLGHPLVFKVQMPVRSDREWPPMGDRPAVVDTVAIGRYRFKPRSPLNFPPSPHPEGWRCLAQGRRPPWPWHGARRDRRLYSPVPIPPSPFLQDADRSALASPPRGG